MIPPETCFLCGEQRELTFEHIPPQCAFNNRPMYVQKHEHLVDESSRVFGKMMKSQRGFGKNCLCAQCNNSTGNWYVKDFCEFTRQGLALLRESTSSVVEGNYTIKTLNVIKQILLMFVCADSSGVLRNHKGVTDYLLNKESQDFPEKINIYLYSNGCVKKRMLGYLFGADIAKGERFQWSEINFKPFGYFLTYDSNPPNEFMARISEFNESRYDEKRMIYLSIGRLLVSNMLIGHYDNVEA